MGEAESGWDFSDRLAALALIVALGSLVVSIRGCVVQQDTYDRASGKIAANFEFIGLGNVDDKHTEPLSKKTSLGFSAIVLQDVNQLIQWNPYVEIKNNGPEIIDGLRVEVRFSGGMIIQNRIENAKPTPYVLNGISELDLPLKVKLNPGQMARVNVLKPLLIQMTQAQAIDERADLEHLGHFEIKVFCKIAGATTPADRPTPYKNATLHFFWIPKGFTKEACKEVVESQPQAIIPQK